MEKTHIFDKDPTVVTGNSIISEDQKKSTLA